LNGPERRILLVTSFGHFMSHYNLGVFSALVLPLTGTLAMDTASVLGLSFWMYLFFGVSALPWGVVGDRVQGRILLGVMFLGSAAASAFAIFSLHDPWALSVSLACLGLFSGIYHPIGMGMISTGVGRVSMAMGYNAVFGGLGLVASPLVSGVFNYYGGPTWPFLVLACLNLAGIAAPMLLTREGGGHQAKRPQDGASEGMLSAFLFLLVATALAGIAFSGATVVLPTYLELRGAGILEEVKSLLGGAFSGNLVATAATAFIYVAGMAGQYVGGCVGEKYDQRYSYLLFHALCVPPVFLMARTSDLPLVGMGTIYFFFLLGMQPFENTLVARFTPRRLRRSAYGFKFVLTFGVGALGVKLVQGIDKADGAQMVFSVLGGVSILVVLSVIGMIISTERAKTRIEAQESKTHA
jgi:MFS family permease